jgi:hypothetical protein
MTVPALRGPRGEVVSLPAEAQRIPERQKLWALYRAEGASLVQATFRAGYDCKDKNSAKALGHQLSVSPAVASAVQAITAQLLKTQAPRALATVTGIMESPKAKDVDRLRAAKMVLDRGGLPAVQEHHSTGRVEHTHRHEAGPSLADLYREAGLPLPANLAPAAPVTDAEFEEVAPDDEPWSV